MTAAKLLVVGGGPAGALAARALAQRGQPVSLIEARAQTDHKVCGACLHPGALRELQRAGLGELVEAAEAPTLHTLVLHRDRREARLKLPLGRVLSRARLDEELLRAAQLAGVDVHRAHTATQLCVTDHSVSLELRDASGTCQTWNASTVLLAHGLGRVRLSGKCKLESVASPPSKRWHAPRARRLGAGAILPSLSIGPPAGELHMFVARAGYLGIVRLETGQLDLAAAFDAHALQRVGGPAQLAAQLLHAARHPLAEVVREAAWRGTAALARPTPSTPPRVLALGDAAGSVEPFTGEGLRRAFCQAHGVVEYALAAAAGDLSAAQRWTRERDRLLRSNTKRVNLLAGVLRHPSALAVGVSLAARWPRVGQQLARRLHGSATHP